LIILLNKATKLSGYFLNLSKEYIATLKLGISTDTWDIDGQIVKTIPADDIHEVDVLKIIKNMQGDYLQEIPAFSAKKVKGKPLYFYARKGIEMDKKKEKVKIYDIDLLAFEKGLCKLRICCSSGTYIRAIANDIGNQLKTGAVLYALKRTKIGRFKSEDAVEMDNMMSIKKDHGGSFLLDLKNLAENDWIAVKKEFVDIIKEGYPLQYDMIDFSRIKNKSYNKNVLITLRDSENNIIAYHKVLKDIDFLRDYDNNLNLTKIISNY
jgi:tRNA pseudouridine55 synthase